MKRLAAAAVLAAFAAAPAAHAELKVGAKAPDFTLQGYQAGKPISFSLAEARKNRDLEETVSPDAALRMELDKREVKYAQNASVKKLRELLADTVAKEEAAKTDGE